MAERHEDLEAHVARIEDALEEALEERNRLWAAAQRTEEVERALAEIRSSLSWRITKPLRIARFLRAQAPSGSGRAVLLPRVAGRPSWSGALRRGRSAVA